MTAAELGGLFAAAGAAGWGCVPYETLSAGMDGSARQRAEELCPGARSVLTAAFSYYAGRTPGNLSLYARGMDSDPVRRASEKDEVKSVGNGMTFQRNLQSMEEVKSGLLFLSETVAARLRKYGLKCCGVQLAIRDPDFKTIDRQCRRDAPTNITREIYAASLEIFARSWRTGDPVRMFTVTGIQLVDQTESVQLDLFGSEKKRDKLEALDSSLDGIRAKYGKGAVKPAAILKNDLGLDE